MEMVDAFSQASAKQIAYQICPRRPGDIAECWSDTSKANSELNWKAKRNLKEMAEDSWRWQSQNPDGYSK